MLTELKTTHREIARLTFEGFVPADIAARLGLSKGVVHKVTRDPLFKAYLGSLDDRADNHVIDVRRELADMNLDAIAALKRILTADDVPYSVMLAGAKDILDRNGHAVKHQVNHVHGHFTKEDLQRLTARADREEELANQASEAIDVEVANA